MTFQIGDRVRVVLNRKQAAEMRRNFLEAHTGQEFTGRVCRTIEDPEDDELIQFIANGPPFDGWLFQFKEIYVKKV